MLGPRRNFEKSPRTYLVLHVVSGILKRNGPPRSVPWSPNNVPEKSPGLGNNGHFGRYKVRVPRYRAWESVLLQDPSEHMHYER